MYTEQARRGIYRYFPNVQNANASAAIPVAIVNQGPTRGDEAASLRIDAPLGMTLAALKGRVGEPRVRSSA